MSFRMIGALLCGAALVLAAQTGAFAETVKGKKLKPAQQGDPVPGIDVSMEQHPGGLATTKPGAKNQAVRTDGTAKKGRMLPY